MENLKKHDTNKNTDIDATVNTSGQNDGNKTDSENEKDVFKDDNRRYDRKYDRRSNPRVRGFLSPFDDNLDDDDEDEDEIIKELNIKNLNDKFRSEDNTLFRDEVVQQLISTLISKNKPNALLVGAAGVGKTKVVESLAHQLENNYRNIPYHLKGYTIYELGVSEVVAGSGIVGTIEKKVRRLVNFMSKKEKKAILFIDEIHLLFNRKEPSYSKISQILKPALARGDMKVIGATTLQESQEILNDPAFNRRFSRIYVDELSKNQSLEILRKIKPSFEKHYKKIVLDDDAIKDILMMSEKYRTPTSHRPDSAITLLDRAMADAFMNVRDEFLEYEKKDCETDVNTCRKDCGTDVNTCEKSVADDKLNNDELNNDEFDNDKWNDDEWKVKLTRKHIEKSAIRLLKGNNAKEDIDFESLKKSLSRIKGQDDVLEKVVKLIKYENSNLFPTLRPLSIMFAGPSGVGKTEVTKILAKEITDMKPIILNMTEYSFNGAESMILGVSESDLEESSKKERPFDILETNPYQIIVLDEFEKASKSVQRIFMQAFDEGYIKNRSGKIIDFSKSIIIATTNASHTQKNNVSGFVNSDSVKNNVRDLSLYFDKELLNRFTKIINFNKITKDVFREIIDNTYIDEVKRIKLLDDIDIDDRLSEEDLDELADKYISDFGARPVYNIVKEFILERVIL